MKFTNQKGESELKSHEILLVPGKVDALFYDRVLFYGFIYSGRKIRSARAESFLLSFHEFLSV